jgi:FkbM family methyltransferase
MDTLVSFRNVTFNMCIPEEESLINYPGDNVQRYISKNKVWAEEETIILSTILDIKKGLVIDVGANTGYFSFIALSKNCPCISIEANEIHTPYFMKTMDLNNFAKDDLTHYEYFVSHKKGDVLFDGWSGYENLMSKDSNNKLVKTIALDEICDECLFLKIDVEGCEPDVIKSASSLLKNNKISFIMFEMTYITNNSVDQNQINMLDSLASYGYNLFEITPKILVEINNIEEKINIWANEFFNNHQKVTPSITNGGCNILAIHKSCENPFQKIGTNSYSLK